MIERTQHNTNIKKNAFAFFAYETRYRERQLDSETWRGRKREGECGADAIAMFKIRWFCNTMINFYASFSRVNVSHTFFSICLLVVAGAAAVCRRHFKLAPICHLTLAKLGPQNVWKQLFVWQWKVSQIEARNRLPKIGKESANICDLKNFQFSRDQNNNSNRQTDLLSWNSKYSTLNASQMLRQIDDALTTNRVYLHACITTSACDL